MEADPAFANAGVAEKKAELQGKADACAEAIQAYKAKLTEAKTRFDALLDKIAAWNKGATDLMFSFADLEEELTDPILVDTYKEAEDLRYVLLFALNCLPSTTVCPQLFALNYCLPSTVCPQPFALN